MSIADDEPRQRGATGNGAANDDATAAAAATPLATSSSSSSFSARAASSSGWPARGGVGSRASNVVALRLLDVIGIARFALELRECL
jgi:hypothetical protein